MVKQSMMGVWRLQLGGLVVMAAFIQALCASDVCSEEVARLREQERLLRIQLQDQELLLQRLRQQTQTDYVAGAGSDQDQDVLHTDCSQIFTSGSKSSGSYRIRTLSSPSPFRVFCDMSDGGGWTVIQRRTNGTQRFDRSWAEYKAGFGDMEAERGEFWLGNDKLHDITTQGNYSLRIVMEDFDGNRRYAEYRNVRVAGEEDQYRLNFGAYVGTAGDALSGTYETGVSHWASHQGMKFSTFDRDNDNYHGNCAKEDSGGWWFNKCHSAHLNGRYYRGGHYNAVTDDGLVWYPWRGWWYSLKTSIMKLRPTDYRPDPVDDPNTVQHRQTG